MKIEDIKLPAKFRLTTKGAKAGVWGKTEGHTETMHSLRTPTFCFDYLTNGEWVVEQSFLDEGYVELVEDSTPIWFGKKYRVNPETSEMLQKEVFAAGGSWHSGDTCVKLLHDEYLFISETGDITHGGGDSEHYESRCLPEATLSIKKELVIESVKDYDETVEVNGKKYRLKDIEALEEVK